LAATRLVATRYGTLSVGTEISCQESIDYVNQRMTV